MLDNQGEKMLLSSVNIFISVLMKYNYICTMETKKAGRKKLPEGEKKIAITIFPKQKDIERVGGVEIAKDIALKAIEKE